MHHHSVFFWLYDSTDASGHAAFRAGLDHLTTEPHIRAKVIGTPAGTRRDVVESGYDYAIHLTFDDREGHDAYQVSPEHQVFLDSCLGMVDRVQVYDVEPLTAEAPA